jgi:SAM-dependent methyltransferase
VPDPGFRYQDSPIGTRRLDGWFRGFRTEVPLWLSVLTPPGIDRIPTGPSEFARWVEPQLGEGAKVVDLGAGTGRDSFHFGEHGHDVLAMDYSRPGLGTMRRIREERSVETPELAERVLVDMIVLNEARMVMHLIGQLSRDPHHLYARGLIGSLDEEARHHLFRLASATLRGGRALFLEFSATRPGADLPMPEPVGLTRRFDVDWLSAELARYGGVIEYLEVAPGTDMYDLPDPAVARMKVVFPRG